MKLFLILSFINNYSSYIVKSKQHLSTFIQESAKIYTESISTTESAKIYTESIYTTESTTTESTTTESTTTTEPISNIVEPTAKPQIQGSRTSIATYYFRVGNDVPGCAPVQNFDDGNSYGPCNGNQGVKYTSDSKYWVAINGAKEYCGKQIRVNYEGNSLDLTIMDECPGCGADDSKIDVGIEALIELTKSKEVACSIGRLQPEVTWDFIN